MTAVWHWDRVGFDFLDVGQSEGWTETLSFQIGPPFSLQRVICRLGCVGSSASSITDADLSTPSWLLALSVYLLIPGETRTYWGGSHGSITNAMAFVTQGQAEHRRDAWHSFAPFDVDVAARYRVPDGAAPVTLGMTVTCTPVPEQNPARFLYRGDFRTSGTLSWLVSGTP